MNPHLVGIIPVVFVTIALTIGYRVLITSVPTGTSVDGSTSGR